MQHLHDLLDFAEVAHRAGFITAKTVNLKLCQVHIALAQQNGGEICEDAWRRYKALSNLS